MNNHMTEKQAAFIREYLLDFNATRAAIRAGYSERTAAEQGYENLRKPQIQTALARFRAEAESDAVMSLQEALETTTTIARDTGERARDRLTAIERLARMQGWDKPEQTEPVEIIIGKDMQGLD